MKKLYAALALLFFPCMALAQEIPIYLDTGAEIGFVNFSTFQIDDDVTDACWTNSKTIQSLVRLSFEQNDVPILDYKPAWYATNVVHTELEAIGFRTSSSNCAVHAAFKVATRVNARFGGAEGRPLFSASYVASVFERSAIFTNSRNVNEQLRDFFEGASSEFLALVLSSRRDKNVISFKSAYPHFANKPLSEEEWREMSEEATRE